MSKYEGIRNRALAIIDLAIATGISVDDAAKAVLSTTPVSYEERIALTHIAMNLRPCWWCRLKRRSGL